MIGSRILFVVLFLSAGVMANDDCAQKLTLEGGWLLGYKYSYNCATPVLLNTSFSIDNNFKSIISSCPNNQAASSLSTAKGWFAVYCITGAIGGALLGWPLGQAIGGGEVNKTMLYASIPFIGFSLISYSVYIKNIRVTMTVYNSGR